MTKADVRIEIKRSGVRELLRSGEVLADLEARAERVAAEAGPGMEASSMVGNNRARASVITTTTQARLAEARERKLTRAFERARG